MLVIQSDNDFRLPVSEGIGLFNVLQERGVPSRFMNFPDESHWYVALPLGMYVCVLIDIGSLNPKTASCGISRCWGG